MKIMARLPEGVRRICVVLSITLSVGWLVMVALAWDFFMRADGKVFPIIGLIAVSLYFGPYVLARVAYWIKDGFQEGK